MLPLLINSVFPYAARILMLLILLSIAGAGLRQLFTSRQLVAAATPKWKYVLAARGVIALNDPSNGDALAALFKTMEQWGTTARRGAATGAIIGVLLSSPLALPLFLRPGSVLDDILWFEFVLFMMLVLRMTAATVGVAVGQSRSESRLALVPGRSTGYNPLLRGRVSDFRATSLLVAPILLWLATVALVATAALGLLQPDMAWDRLPLVQRPLLVALPLISALSVIIVELVSRVRAIARQRVFTYQTMISREVDFTIRAANIGGHYQTQLNICIIALLGQCLILLLLGRLLGSLSFLGLCFAVYFSALLFMRFANRRIARTGGQLGGRLTGWPGQKHAMPQAAG
jgi:hypothetical protein